MTFKTYLPYIISALMLMLSPGCCWSASNQQPLSFSDLLYLYYHYGEEGVAEKTGLSFLYEINEESEDGDVGYHEVVLARDVEYTKRAEFGYDLKAKSEHACYFMAGEDTSRHACLCFASQEDANSFFEAVCNAKPCTFDDMKVVINKDSANSKVVRVEEVMEDGSTSSLFDVISPEFEDGFYKIELSAYY